MDEVHAGRQPLLPQDFKAREALALVGDDATVRTRAPLEKGMRALFQLQQRPHDAPALGKRSVQLPPENVAHGRHRVAKVLQLLPRLVQHVADAGVVVRDRVAQMLHDADFNNVPHPLQKHIDAAKVQDKQGPHKAIHVNPRHKRHRPRARGIQPQQRALHGLHQMLDPLHAVLLPLQLPVRPLGSPPQWRALPQKQKDLLEIGDVVPRPIDDGDGVEGKVRQVVIMRNAAPRQHKMLKALAAARHQVAVDLRLVFFVPGAQMRMVLLQQRLESRIEFAKDGMVVDAFRW